jgi:hypothetical protein
LRKTCKLHAGAVVIVGDVRIVVLAGSRGQSPKPAIGTQPRSARLHAGKPPRARNKDEQGPTG